MSNKFATLILVLILLAISPVLVRAGQVSLVATHLTCESVANPIGIDAANPALSWQLTSDSRGARQSAYQILVATSPQLLQPGHADLWDSGKIESDETIDVPYAGKPLSSLQTCYWTVRAWDAEAHAGDFSQPASWTMGLLHTSDWTGKWITASHWFMPPKFRPPGFMSIASETAETPCWVAVDLGRSLPIERIVLTATDGRFNAFPRRFKIEADDTSDFDHPKTIADCSGADVSLDPHGKIELKCDGSSARWVRLLIVKSPPINSGSAKPAHPQFQSMLRQMEVYSGGTNVALIRKALESGHYWDKGHGVFLFDGMPSAGEGADCPDDAIATTTAPMFRKSFQLDKPLRRAILAYAVLGMADVSIDGKKVGTNVLDPPFTDYTKRVIYRVFDVTHTLSPGENVLGVILGNGFFSTPNRGFGQRMNGQGQPRLLAQLNLEFADGSTQTIVTDPSWTWAKSEIVFNDVWTGYTEVRSLAQEGWDRPVFAAGDGWRPVAVTDGLGGELTTSSGPPGRVCSQLSPVRVEKNVAYFNILTSGWPKLHVLHGRAGEHIVITGNALATADFTLAADGPTWLEPRFVYSAGPLKITVAGLEEPLLADNISFQEVHADQTLTGSFHCSNEFLNHMSKVLLQTHLNYNLEHPLDPTREKQGWTQDAQNMFDTAAYLADVSQLYRKWWRDMADNQQENGLVGSVVPLVNRQVDDWNCPWWSGMIVWLPWEHYLYYGDKRVLADAYQPMRRYVDWLGELTAAGGGKRALDYPDTHLFLDQEAAAHGELIWQGASDWYAPSGKADGVIMNMTAWYDYASIVSHTAEMLGNHADATKYRALASQIRKTLNDHKLNRQTGQYGDGPLTQTNQLMPLELGLVPDDIRPLTEARLIDAIHARHDHLGTGFVALPYLLQHLTNSYDTALANRIINQPDFPSWKTLEHDGVLGENWHGAGAQMPSCGGCIGMWMYQSVLGIRPDASAPGFKHFLIAPQPDPATGLTHADGWFDSIHGRIVSSWKIENGKIRINVTIPPNTSAAVRIPTTHPDSVTESDLPLAKSTGVTIASHDKSAIVVNADSGTYQFVATSP